MPALTLYSTVGCHLCEDAEALLRDAREEFPALSWTVVDIADNDALFERYGWLIPVLRGPADKELRWPFDAPALADFLRRENPAAT